MLSHFSCQKHIYNIIYSSKTAAHIFTFGSKLSSTPNICCICLSIAIEMWFSVTHRRGQYDVGVLNLKEVINLRVTCELLAVQPQRTKLLPPALKALTAQSFDRGHWQTQTVNLITRQFFLPHKYPQSITESKNQNTLGMLHMSKSEEKCSKCRCVIIKRCIVSKHCFV